jgi:hypothetical protein
LDYGPSPFKFYSSWLNKPLLEETVINAYNSVVVNSGDRADMVLCKKLKAIKDAIKVWVIKHKEVANQEIDELATQCEFWESRAELGLVNDADMDVWSHQKSRLLDLEADRMADVRQKSWVKSAVDGDENTAFFHGVCKAHIAGNHVNGLHLHGTWTTNPKAVKKAIWQFFRNKI